VLAESKKERTDIRTETHTDKGLYREREHTANKHTYIQSYRQMDRQTGRQTGRRTDGEIDRQTDRLADRQAGRQTDKTDIQT
jgi:hypothetical protein